MHTCLHEKDSIDVALPPPLLPQRLRMRVPMCRHAMLRPCRLTCPAPPAKPLRLQWPGLVHPLAALTRVWMLTLPP